DKGAWSNFAGNPLVDVVYALAYLPFRHSPYWMVQSCGFGRLILFSLLWLSATLVAGQFSAFAPPVLAAGLLFVTPLAGDMVHFPSDPLFASMAGFSLWQLLRFYHTRHTRHLALASFFMGLAALARNDGLFLFVILACLALYLILRGGRILLNSAAILLPFAVLVGGYILIYGLFTGNFDPGVMRRTYDNFEAGQQVIYGGTGEVNAVTEAKLAARQAFGTPQENGYSVFNAIRRSPRVYLQRLEITIKNLPNQVLHAYGIRFAALLFLLALRGLIELVVRKKYFLMAATLLWPLHLTTGIAITLYREGHLLFPFFIVFALCAIGLAALLRHLGDRRERLVWTALLLALVVYGIFANKLAIYYGAVVFLVAIWVIYLFKSRFQGEREASIAPLLILLLAGIILRGSFPSPVLPALGTEAREQASVYLAQRLPPDSIVAAASPGPVWAAKMVFANLAATDFPHLTTPQEFEAWMKAEGVQAVYVDHTLTHDNPATWDLIKPLAGRSLQRVFSGEAGDIQVFIVKSAP
ncbi:MAG: hypothetical protein ACM3PY_10320, partial [Omnitrophica WOR_2 bacterium]